MTEMRCITIAVLPITLLKDSTSSSTVALLYYVVIICLEAFSHSWLRYLRRALNGVPGQCLRKE